MTGPVGLADAAPCSQAQAGLKIVVIEGEDAVNIIQQKTAVAPIIEVRDRNDLPVPGAVVTFAVQGGKAASFAGGVPTLTVTTNAAGQAVAAGFSPLASGAVQINVSAAFQGQTIAATIAQTNVLTAAEAAAAAGASGATGATGATGASGASGASGGTGASGASGASGATGATGAAGGGGLSGAMIGAVGAAAAAGTVATVAATSGEDKPAGPTTYSGPFSGQFVSTGSSTGAPVCTITRAISGTMTITLETRSDGSVSGPAQIEGTDVVVARTCQGDPVNTSFSGREQITGTAASMGFTRESTNTSTTPQGNTFISTNTVVFSASLSGGVITGTLSYKEQGTIQDREVPVQTSGSTSFPITLR